MREQLPKRFTIASYPLEFVDLGLLALAALELKELFQQQQRMHQVPYTTYQYLCGLLKIASEMTTIKQLKVP
jgi:hypothetical protein